jgi:hydrazine synthase alpha subunit-like protein/WD40 repeat protein
MEEGIPMSIRAWSDRIISSLQRMGAPLCGGVVLLLAGCGGGDGSVGVGQGQQPDPVAPDFAIAYTKGPLFDDDEELQQSADLRSLVRCNVGTDLYMKDRASPTAVERNITFRETDGEGDVQGVEISQDGKKILFSMRTPCPDDLDDPPTWNVWEYDIASDALRRIIASDITAEAGQDISPHYLPDGRIIFASTRQRTAKAILLDEGKPQFEAMDENRDEPAYVLHVMDSDGENLHQVSFNQSNDYDPTVLENGKVLFSRWDHAGSVNGIHLYQMNPDGTGLELLYGAESHATGTNNSQVQFVSAREMRDGKIMAVVRPFNQDELGGAITIIDASTYVENTQPIADFPGMTGPAQVAATPNQVRTDDLVSQGGRFSSAFPLWDGTGRVLVSWAICRLEEPDPANPTDPEAVIFVPCTDARLAVTDPEPVPAPPLYGIWMYDPVTRTQQPIVIGEEGVLIGDVVAAQPRGTPDSIPDFTPSTDLERELAAEGTGILNIRSVYDVDGVASVNIGAVADPLITAAAERPARFLRIEKAVSIPDEDIVDLDNTAFGPNIQQGMREILGYAPIEPDGSVRVKVPANVAFAISVLDANGRRTPTSGLSGPAGSRHQNWLQVLPGQELKCNGCHAPPSNLSHGRAESFDAAYAGASGTGVPFPNTVGTFSPDVGDTMAEVRTRVSCQTDNCAALVPSVDLVYTDVWTNPIVRTPDASFTYSYANLTTDAPVTDLNCLADWTPRCRIVINYERHIHPLWSVAGATRTVGGANVTCSQGGCHAPTNAATMVAVPAGQLDLTDGPSEDEPDQFKAYRELLFADNAQIVMNGALVDEQVSIGTDAMGNPILEPVSVGASMSSAGARVSVRFFDRFAAGGTHAGYLTTAELRMIAEWLDVGAQYYNNPFDAPVM